MSEWPVNMRKNSAVYNRVQCTLTARETAMSTSNPQLIVIFSGKRKSGKDYVTDLIHTR